ncbi:Aldo/keto reductase [Alkalibacterium subtropicum]|uniref:Aldo/keto reductase n=1 Tax=Alkalibacterium subtropicum TaxID=753702 RepID=A0A1I1FIZ5_9LACT|nr:aldo/keto reductase [Alkalibacterium subtropicum]SFB99274.1 Aldo/keto reductase [Alkalibacterium subtropicum]
MENVILANGLKMPVLGFGMWQNTNEDEAVKSVLKAIEVGFRHIDNAAAYQNEDLVGDALRESGFPREELFLTSKLRNGAHGYDNVRREVEESLRKLGTDYLDLYLIHWPVVEGHGEDWEEDNIDTWKAMEELYEEGVLKAIGVSNFSINHLENLVDHARIKPMVNQMLIHPGVTQDELREYCRKNDIVVQAYSPLNPLNVLKKEDRMREMLNKYNKTMAQILLRFCLDLDTVPLTKSAHMYRIEENFDIFDFKLDEKDFEYLYQWQHSDFQESNNQNERPPQIS